MLVRTFTVCASVLLLAWSAAAQPNSVGSVGSLVNQPVVSVRVVTDGQEVRDPQIMSLLDVRAGAPLSMDAVRRTIGRIMGLGIYIDVQIHGRPVPGGVSLEITLVPATKVRRIDFVGSTELPEQVLRDVITARFGTSPAVGRATDIARTLEEVYRDRGYLRATVQPRPLDDQGSAPGTLTFDIAARTRATIRTLAFRGSPDAVVARIRDDLRLREGADYDPATLGAQLASHRRAFRAGGYLQARVDPFPAVNDTAEQVDLTILVTQGPRVTVRFAGDPLPPKERDALVPIAQEGSADEDLLEDSERRIEDYLRAQGHRDAKAPFTPSESGGQLEIVFTIARGPLYRMASIDVAGVTAGPSADVLSLIRSKPGDPYVQARVDRDVTAIVDDYRRRGFASVRVASAVTLAARATPGGDVPAAVTLTVAEGLCTVVRAVTFDGVRQFDEAPLRGLLRTNVGDPFYGPRIETDRAQVMAAYRDRGYRRVTVEPAVRVSASGTDADIRFVINEGPQILVDHILIVGQTRTSEETIRRELTLHSGDALGDAAVAESQRRLAGLGLFRRVTISELPNEAANRHDVVIRVEDAPATTVGYGGGVEFQKVETSEFAPRGFFEVGRRNLWGKNRAVNLFSRVSLRRRASASDVPTIRDQVDTNLEYRVVGSYREPRIWSSRGDLQVATVFEQGSRTSFRYRHRSARLEFAERRGRDFSYFGQFAVERNEIFDDGINPLDRPLIDRLFPQVRLSSVSGTAARDTRDDAIEPGGGALLSINGELALRAIGSEVGYVKTYAQGFLYRRLRLQPRVVLAGGARLGLGTGFRRTVDLKGPNGQPVSGPDGRPLTVEVRDLPASKRFFAGGDTSVRGFDLDHLGTPDTFDRDGTPIGGHAEIILNGEVRLALWREFGIVGFVDAGNVFATVNDVSLRDMRSGVGCGIRYKSPIGPIRVDFGFKVGTLRTFGANHEERRALHISIGQAF
jgi:outer membrane protein insertion porin family